MCQKNKSSIEVNYNILAIECQGLAHILTEAPTEVCGNQIFIVGLYRCLFFKVLKILDEVAKSVVLNMFPNYESVAKDIHVVISQLPFPEDPSCSMQLYQNKLIRTSARPQLLQNELITTNARPRPRKVTCNDNVQVHIIEPVSFSPQKSTEITFFFPETT